MESARLKKRKRQYGFTPRVSSLLEAYNLGHPPFDTFRVKDGRVFINGREIHYVTKYKTKFNANSGWLRVNLGFLAREG